MPNRSSLDQELLSLRGLIADMPNRADELFVNAMTTLLQCDTQLAAQVVA